MSNPFAVHFFLTKEGHSVEVESPEYIELTRLESEDIRDACESYAIEDNIQHDEKIENLPDGHYECILAGKWEWEMSYDWESGTPDGEVLFNITMLEFQKVTDHL